mmetsp:Transcript_2544/g.6533  ORF Transcript_2544/g.6533 Transcript_2544/m.6533 type:complete len:80 (-) Transcript_2544:236-475(-)
MQAEDKAEGDGDDERRKGTWTADDDWKLASLVDNYRQQGREPNWATIARKLKKGAGRACHDRWVGHAGRQTQTCDDEKP